MPPFVDVIAGQCRSVLDQVEGDRSHCRRVPCSGWVIIIAHKVCVVVCYRIDEVPAHPDATSSTGAFTWSISTTTEGAALP